MLQKLQKVNILFWLCKSRGNETSAPLRCRVSINKQRYDFGVDCTVPYDLWIAEAQCCKVHTKRGKEINLIINTLRDQIEEATQELIREYKPLTIDNLKSKLNPEKEEFHTVLSLFDYHQVIEKKNLSPATLKLYKVTRNHASKFMRIKYKAKDVDIRTIRKDFAAEFFAYLQGWKRDPDEKVCENNAAIKHMQRITRVFKIAFDNEWIEKNPFIHFHASTKDKDKEFLEDEEILRIQQTKDLSLPETITKDCFVFAIYTAISYVDITKLTADNITKGIDGKEWIVYRRHKTGVRVMVPLLDPAKEIIQKYGYLTKYMATKPLLPIATNQQCNRDLKVIARKANIRKKVTFHMSRHTFATTIALSNGIPIETLSSMLGHKSIKTTQIYAQIVGHKVTQDSVMLRNIYDKPKELTTAINQ